MKGKIRAGCGLGYRTEHHEEDNGNDEPTERPADPPDQDEARKPDSGQSSP